MGSIGNAGVHVESHDSELHKIQAKTTGSVDRRFALSVVDTKSEVQITFWYLFQLQREHYSPYRPAKKDSSLAREKKKGMDSEFSKKVRGQVSPTELSVRSPPRVLFQTFFFICDRHKHGFGNHTSRTDTRDLFISDPH